MARASALKPPSPSPKGAVSISLMLVQGLERDKGPLAIGFASINPKGSLIVNFGTVPISLILVPGRHGPLSYKRVPGAGSDPAVGRQAHEVEGFRFRFQPPCQAGRGLATPSEGTRPAFPPMALHWANLPGRASRPRGAHTAAPGCGPSPEHGRYTHTGRAWVPVRRQAQDP